MKIKAKINNFTDSIEKEILKRKNTIIDNAKKDIDLKLNDTITSAKKNVDQEISQSLIKFEQNKNKQIVSALSKSKIELINIRKKLIDGLFSNVEELVNNYLKTEDYKNNLINDIKEIENKYKSFTKIFVSKNDFSLLKNVFNNDMTEITEADFNIIGGFVAYIKEKEIKIDNSFAKRFEESKENFTGIKIS